MTNKVLYMCEKIMDQTKTIIYNKALYTCQTCNPKPMVLFTNEFDITRYYITNDI